METEKRSKLKIAVTVLSVLLAISIVALAGVIVYNRRSPDTDATVTVPDNLITPDKADNESSEVSTVESSESSLPTESSRPSSETSSKTFSAGGGKTASKISLYKKHPDDNKSFALENMFPGDSEVKNFCVQVSYKGTVTVHYQAKLRNGENKLAEVLNLRIKMLNDDSVLYDGPISDMPTSVTYKLSSEQEATTELYYEISAYIPETVGNEYQSKSIVADFLWWAEGTESLIPAPGTGDNSIAWVFALVALVSGVVLTVMIVVLKREEDGENA